ncbi:ComEC/Rec2 family competence protein [Spirosoma gilvum]
MQVKIVKAENGDCLLISFFDSENSQRNILIDGGTPNTYQYKGKKGKIIDGELKKELNIIESKNQFIDLLILTHVDSDHIGGIIKWVESKNNFDKLVKKIWFNSGRLINEKFKEKPIIENDIKLNIKTNTNTSIEEGQTFEEYIKTKNTWQEELISQGKEFNFYDLKFQILTPSQVKLKSLLGKWEKEIPHLLTSKKNDYEKTLKELIEKDKFSEDKSIHNGSSIAFILKKDCKNLLFLADAHPTDIIKGLKCFGYDKNNKIKAGLVKLSHHGSKKNTNQELLDCIEANLFIISSNGKIHNLPDKQCLARIINNKENSNLAFNYPEKIREIFTDDEFNSYRFNAIEINSDILL